MLGEVRPIKVGTDYESCHSDSACWFAYKFLMSNFYAKALNYLTWNVETKTLNVDSDFQGLLSQN